MSLLETVRYLFGALTGKRKAPDSSQNDDTDIHVRKRLKANHLSGSKSKLDGVVDTHCLNTMPRRLSERAIWRFIE